MDDALFTSTALLEICMNSRHTYARARERERERGIARDG
jgi:hypothetical protein